MCGLVLPAFLRAIIYLAQNFEVGVYPLPPGEGGPPAKREPERAKHQKKAGG
jgi:hypothetical protein